MRVLVVEDNSDAARSLAAVLRLWGFDADVASDGLAALETAPRTRPDVVLIDIGLPGMDGFELARQLAATPELKGCLLAAVTAYGDAETRTRSRQAGMLEHFCKPADLVALHRLLDARREAIRQQREPQIPRGFFPSAG